MNKIITYTVFLSLAFFSVLGIENERTKIAESYTDLSFMRIAVATPFTQDNDKKEIFVEKKIAPIKIASKKIDQKKPSKKIVKSKKEKKITKKMNSKKAVTVKNSSKKKKIAS